MIRRDAVQRGLFMVDHERQLLLIVLDIRVDINHTGSGFEDAPNFARQQRSAGVGRTVDFSHQRL
jgi:hypothetical protein